MGAITDLFNSERGLFAVLLVIAATALVVAGKMTVDSWQSFVKVIFGAYVAGKTVTGAVNLVAQRRVATSDKTKK